MLIVQVHVRVKPESIEAFRRATVENARQSRNEAGIARFGLRAQTSRDRVEEPAHECQVRVIGVQLLFDAINRFDHVFLIAAREGHARYGKLNGNQRLMYCGLLRPIHGWEFEPVCRKPQAQKTKAPPGAGLS